MNLIIRSPSCKRIILSIMLMYAAIYLSTLPALGQEQVSRDFAVDAVETLAYYDDDAHTVYVVGDIQNLLEVDIFEVEIAGLLLHDDNQFSVNAVNISKIEAGVSASFELEISTDRKPASFSVFVVSYQFQTQDIDTLFEYFWMYEDDFILTKSIAAYFETPPDEAIPLIISRFQSDPPQRGKASVVLLEEILMIPIVSQNQSIDAIQALVDKEPIYSSQEYEHAFSEIKQSLCNGDESFSSILNEVCRNNQTLLDVWYDALLNIDEQKTSSLLEDENAAIRRKLGELYFERGQSLRLMGDQVEAMEYLQKAQLHLGDQPEIRMEIGKAFARNNWLLILIGVVIFIGTSYKIQGSQKT